MERIYTFAENHCHCKSCGRKWVVTEGDGIDLMKWYPKTKECPSCHSKMVELSSRHPYVGDRYGNYVRELTLEDSNKAVKQAEQELEQAEQRLKYTQRKYQEKPKKTMQNVVLLVIWFSLAMCLFMLTK